MQLGAVGGVEGMGVRNERGNAPGDTKGVGKRTSLFRKRIWTNFINVGIMGIKLVDNS
jgi:hypothetical protein